MIAIDGLDEFTRALRALPDELRREAGASVARIAKDAEAEVRAAYERVHSDKTGGDHLADHVMTVVDDGGTSYARAWVRSKSPHSHLYEFGTATRAFKTRQGNSGATGPHPTFVPIVQRSRKRMKAELVAIVKKIGLEVSGE